MKKIIIVGGGFGGINLATGLANSKNYVVMLVDKNNYNFFPPLIYQVATAYLEPSNISYPFRKLFYKKENLNFRLGELRKVVPAENKVILADGELEYDFLVFATGAQTNYFGMKNVEKNAIPMKTLNDAIAMRNVLLQRMEEASAATDETVIRKNSTIVIAGGGPTGVEISGMFAEMSKNVLRDEYRELKDVKSQIILIDGGDVLLKPMSPLAQNYTYDKLTQMGITIKLGVQVKDFYDDQVFLDNGEVINARSLIWAAGISAKRFDGMPEFVYCRSNRMYVDEFNKVNGIDNIYAIGDTYMQLSNKNHPGGHPQVGQVALQQGKNLAKNFKLMAQSKPLLPFSYFDKGSMAIIGKNKAVADLPKLNLHFRGFLAFLMWIFVHLAFLINQRNRLKTFINWTLAYFSGDQSLRMIIRPGDPDHLQFADGIIALKDLTQ
jgi:NADH dehydrogenase